MKTEALGYEMFGGYTYRSCGHFCLWYSACCRCDPWKLTELELSPCRVCR